MRSITTRSIGKHRAKQEKLRRRHTLAVKYADQQKKPEGKAKLLPDNDRRIGLLATYAEQRSDHRYTTIYYFILPHNDAKVRLVIYANDDDRTEVLDENDNLVLLFTSSGDAYDAGMKSIGRIVATGSHFYPEDMASVIKFEPILPDFPVVHQGYDRNGEEYLQLERRIAVEYTAYMAALEEDSDAPLNRANRKSSEEIRHNQELAKGHHGLTVIEHGKEATYRFLHSFHATDIPRSISRNALTEVIYKLMLKHSNDALVIMRGEDLLPLMSLKNGQVYDPRNWHIGSIVVMAGKIGMSPVLKFVSATNDFLLPEMPYHHNSPPRNYYAFFIEVFREFQLSQLNKLMQG